MHTNPMWSKIIRYFRTSHTSCFVLAHEAQWARVLWSFSRDDEKDNNYDSDSHDDKNNDDKDKDNNNDKYDNNDKDGNKHNNDKNKHDNDDNDNSNDNAHPKKRDNDNNHKK